MSLILSTGFNAYANFIIPMKYLQIYTQQTTCQLTYYTVLRQREHQVDDTKA
jgi:hypothetical protein